MILPEFVAELLANTTSQGALFRFSKAYKNDAVQ
jgi:hypothetical protein